MMCAGERSVADSASRGRVAVAGAALLCVLSLVGCASEPKIPCARVPGGEELWRDAHGVVWPSEELCESFSESQR